MPSLNVPRLRQDKEGWCLPACVAMVAAYWGQPLLQADIANWERDLRPLLPQFVPYEDARQGVVERLK